MPSIVQRLIWGKEVSERREALEERSVPTGKSKRARKERQAIEEERKAVRGLSRRAILLRGGAAVLAGGVALTMYSEDEEVQSLDDNRPLSGPSVETTVSKEVVLGNIRFHFEAGSGFSPTEKQGALDNIRAAYKKYVDYFGEEVMQFPRRINCTITKDPSLIQNGFVQWKVVGSPATSGDMVNVQTPILERFVLNDHSESVVAHEFMHLFLQPEGAQSKSFHEGHAYVTQQLLGYSTSQDENFALFKENPKFSKLFDLGLDHSFVDEGYGGGITDIELLILTQSKFAVEWGRLLEMDPEFIKNYYRLIAEKRTSGVIGFTKADMIEVARQASPYFDEWEGSTHAIKDLGSDGRRIGNAVVIPGKGLIIVNFETKPRIVQGDKMTPPSIAYVPGEIVIRITQKNGEVITRTFESPGFHINKFSFSDKVLEGADIKVTIGGYDMPVII